MNTNITPRKRKSMDVLITTRTTRVPTTIFQVDVMAESSNSSRIDIGLISEELLELLQLHRPDYRLVFVA